MEGCVLPLVIEPDPLLHLVSDIVDEVDDSIRLLMADMLATTRHNKGIGLAAIQVGVRKKVIIIDIDLQHEIDHSNGIVFLDHLSRLKKHMALDKLKKLKARGEQAS